MSTCMRRPVIPNLAEGFPDTEQDVLDGILLVNK